MNSETLRIVKKRWEATQEIAAVIYQNRELVSESSGFFDIILTFGSAIFLFITERCELPEKESQMYYEIQAKREKIGENHPFVIIADAILENKKTELEANIEVESEIDQEFHNLVLKAAIVLANEIVSKKSSSL
jgi:hypothetical protein